MTNIINIKAVKYLKKKARCSEADALFKQTDKLLYNMRNYLSCNACALALSHPATCYSSEAEMVFAKLTTAYTHVIGSATNTRCSHIVEPCYCCSDVAANFFITVSGLKYSVVGIIIFDANGTGITADSMIFDVYAVTNNGKVHCYERK